MTHDGAVRFSPFVLFFLLLLKINRQCAVLHPLQLPGPGAAEDFAPFWFVTWDEDEHELRSGKIFIARFWLL
jgi:hypothetical protein